MAEKVTIGNCQLAVNLAIDTLDQFYKYGYDREQCFDALCDLRFRIGLINETSRKEEQ